MDGRIDRHRITAIGRACTASRGENWKLKYDNGPMHFRSSLPSSQSFSLSQRNSAATHRPLWHWKLPVGQLGYGSSDVGTHDRWSVTLIVMPWGQPQCRCRRRSSSPTMKQKCEQSTLFPEHGILLSIYKHMKWQYTGRANKKTIPLMFDNNFGKCGPIFKFFRQLIRNKIIYVPNTIKSSITPAMCCYTTLWNSKIQKCCWFWQHPLQTVDVFLGHFSTWFTSTDCSWQ